jgi:hypothetical protein
MANDASPRKAVLDGLESVKKNHQVAGPQGMGGRLDALPTLLAVTHPRGECARFQRGQPDLDIPWIYR